MIRDAVAADADGWGALWQGYLDFYGVTLDPAVTAATWARILDARHPLSCRVAEVAGGLAGFAVWTRHASSWVLADDCYLEDLFVAPAQRGTGLGRALIDDLAALARAGGCGRLYWHTRESNAQARALYDSYVAWDGHIRYRMTL